MSSRPVLHVALPYIFVGRFGQDAQYLAYGDVLLVFEQPFLRLLPSSSCDVLHVSTTLGIFSCMLDG